MRERLQKILARAGHGSRRAAETLVTSGRVTVNGQVVRELGAQADPERDIIELDGQRVGPGHAHAYLAMHKPAGFVTTAHDPQQRRIVMELLPPDAPPNAVPVGRLDRDTEGLLLFTNDGVLAHRLAHPRYGVEKEYAALVAGMPDEAALEALRRGVEIETGMTAPARAERASAPAGHDTPPGHAWLRIVLHEGRKRQVRRMCEAVGHPVRTLVRTRIDGVLLAGLERGETRPLTAGEIASLRAALGLSGEEA
ncbi:MAG TPA: pseudouridine synthase [Dehalococcoidia bacterium]|nr:pseudouridine synthase [Dehalococcoidia bacterium]